MVDRLSLSLVVYHSDTQLLQQTLQTLYVAASKAQSAGLIADFFLSIVDNAEQPDQLASADCYAPWTKDRLLVYTPGNVGYGAGHNLAIKAHCEAFHLVINPDVMVNEDALIAGIQYLRQHSRVGMVTPQCQRLDGSPEYLCKTYPSVSILLLRGFAPALLKRFFKEKLAAYEISYEQLLQQPEILIASGCFMLFKRQALSDVQGFCEQFFLYFEDFDLTMRLAKNWQIAYVPAVKIVHYGGHSAKKGWRHIALFVRSAQLFFSRHGWRL